MAERNPRTEVRKCAKPGCENSYRVHRWGSTKAVGDGWFIQKDDTAWCPEHVPEWVGEWRARQRSRRGKQ